ncbi:MAG: hypothetical protein Q8Q39_05865 [bacterium]|nr:hypothetical protein [bacterium]
MEKTRTKVVLLQGQKVELVRRLFKEDVPEGVIVRPNPRVITHYHTYGGISRFFEGLAQGKLMGTYCSTINCEHRIWLPPRAHCPDCWEPMHWVEIPAAGAKVYTHSTTNYPGEGFELSVPCPLISVEIPGVCTKFMSYLSEFGEGEPYIGMPIKPAFRTENPTYSILDVSWVPAETLLPSGST